jgi:hypothetical protein
VSGDEGDEFGVGFAVDGAGAEVRVEAARAEEGELAGAGTGFDFDLNDGHARRDLRVFGGIRPGGRHFARPYGAAAVWSMNPMGPIERSWSDGWPFSRSEELEDFGADEGGEFALIAGRAIRARHIMSANLGTGQNFGTAGRILMGSPTKNPPSQPTFPRTDPDGVVNMPFVARISFAKPTLERDFPP